MNHSFKNCFSGPISYRVFRETAPRCLIESVHLGDLKSRNNLLEHDGEFFERFLGHTSSIAGLDLLFQIVFHAHGELIQLIPLLCKVHGAVFSVPVNGQNKFFKYSVSDPWHQTAGNLGPRNETAPQASASEI